MTPRHRETPRYPEAYIEHWAELFIKRRVRARLHITFELFLERPVQFMNRIERFESGERTSRQLTSALQAIVDRSAVQAALRGDQLISPSPRDRKRWRRPWFFSRFWRTKR